MSRLRWLFFWRRQHDDLMREMDAHIAERVDALVDDGVSEADARLQARREFGNVTLQNEQSDAVWRWQWLDIVRASLRDAARTFVRSAATVTTCLLVLGAATGLFVASAVIADNLLLRPIRLPGIDRVVGIGGLADPGLGWTFKDWWGQAGSLEKLTRWSAGLTQLATADGRFLVNTAYVDSDFPELFPARPIMGRGLGPNDFGDSSPVPVVINEATWDSRFDRDPGVVGATATLSDVPVVVVGVLPAQSAYRHDIQIWVPRPAGVPFTILRPTGSGVQARLVDGATVEDARRDVQALGTRLNDEHGAQTGVTYFGMCSLQPISERQALPLRIPVLALVVGSLAVLLMAMSNTATLLLNLVVDRRQELAVRASLGAARRRLVGQIGLESALVGAVAGVLGGVSGVALLIASRPLLAPLSPYLVSVQAIWPTLLIGVGLGTVLGLAVGLAPLSLSFAWRDWHLLQHRALDRGSRRGRRLRTTLVAVQIAAAMMLLTVAAAAMQAFLVSNQTTLGFDPNRVLAVRLMVPAGSPARESVDAIAQNARAAGLVEASAGADRLPVVDTGGMLFVGPQNMSPTRVLSVEPGFFRAMGIELVAGREFVAGDAGSAVISETLARRFWPDRSPVGETIQVSPKDSREVVGVVRDIQEDINANSMWGPGTGGALLYSVMTDRSTAGGGRPQTRSVVMRCVGRCEDAVPQVRTIIESAGATIIDITSLEAALEGKVAPSRLRSVMAVACGLFGLLLALTGIYGVVRHLTSSRLQEMNIRMALGATPAQARTVVIRYGTLLVFVGTVTGSGLGWLVLSAGQSLLYGVSAAHPGSYLAAASALLAGGLLASIGPARRLGRLDPRRLLGES